MFWGGRAEVVEEEEGRGNEPVDFGAKRIVEAGAMMRCCVCLLGWGGGMAGAG